MEFIDALQENAEILAKKTKELNDRINLMKENGHSADVTTKELIKTCVEIGKLNDAINKELHRTV